MSIFVPPKVTFYLQIMRYFAFSFAFMALVLCSCHNNKSESANPQAEVQDTLKTASDGADSIKQSAVTDTTKASVRTITKDMAYEGVDNYCHSTYDWSSAQTDSVTMYVTMGEETETDYEVLFRSYTGALVYFYVDKESGSTRIVEHVPALGVTNEAGTIDLFDYIGKAGDKTEE
jgi:hypothetical protein